MSTASELAQEARDIVSKMNQAPSQSGQTPGGSYGQQQIQQQVHAALQTLYECRSKFEQAITVVETIAQQVPQWASSGGQSNDPQTRDAVQKLATLTESLAREFERSSR